MKLPRSTCWLVLLATQRLQEIRRWLTPKVSNVRKLAMRYALTCLKQAAAAVRGHPFLCVAFFGFGVVVGAVLIQSIDSPLPYGRMGYRGYSNEQLASEALTMARSLRELAKNSNVAAETIRLDCTSREDAAQTQELKSQIRRNCNEAFIATMQQFLAQYDETYKANALILREELVHRLPELRAQVPPAVLYMHPTNPLGLEAVASSLEVLAKLLPKKSEKRGA